MIVFFACGTCTWTSVHLVAPATTHPTLQLAPKSQKQHTKSSRRCATPSARHAGGSERREYSRLPRVFRPTHDPRPTTTNNPVRDATTHVSRSRVHVQLPPYSCTTAVPLHQHNPIAIEFCTAAHSCSTPCRKALYLAIF